MAKEARNLVVALDIGTSKVACLVAELGPDGRLEVLGMGNHDSRGLKKGVVVNIESTVNAIQRALEEAEGILTPTQRQGEVIAERLVLTPRYAWQLRLANGLSLVLGRDADVAEKRLERFVAAYEQTVAQLPGRHDYVDLRYANGFAVRVKG